MSICETLKPTRFSQTQSEESTRNGTRNINADPRTQNVYDAALAFSDAARALSQATSDLKTLTATGAAEPATVQEATNELNKLVENLRLIERELYRLFKTHPAP